MLTLRWQAVPTWRKESAYILMSSIYGPLADIYPCKHVHLAETCPCEGGLYLVTTHVPHLHLPIYRATYYDGNLEGAMMFLESGLWDHD